MHPGLAKDTIALLSEARICAIDLGYDYISTVHLFLADCKQAGNQSIRKFVFKTDEDFQQFYESQRATESTFFDSIVIDSLPVTLELEQAIRTAKKLYDSPIQPHHLFLAASQLKETLFYSILEPKQGLYERLKDYYRQGGLALTYKERKRFW